MINMYNDFSIKTPTGLRVYTRTTIDNRWPLYMKIMALDMLREYGVILMDDTTGYPVEVDMYTRDQIFNQLY